MLKFAVNFNKRTEYYMSLKSTAAAFVTAALLTASAALSTSAYAASKTTEVRISHESGYYDTTQFVTMISDGSTEIYYTTDGSKPDSESSLYDGKPIIIEENTVVRMASYDGSDVVATDKVSIKIRSAVPSASVSGGTYNDSIKVKLTCLDPEADIYYTTDGTAPTRDSKKYKKTITISEDTTLKFAAFAPGLSRSRVITEKYVISDDEFDNSLCQALFELVNETRGEYGLKPLKTLPDLTEAAEIRAKEYSYYQSHYRPDGTKWDSILAAYGLRRNNRAENLAYYYETAKGVLKCWMSDPWHRGNILNPDAKYIGIGCYDNGYAKYWCQLFIGGE